MVAKTGVIEFINNAAATMTECGGAKNAIGLDYGLVIKIESKEGREFSEQENPLSRAIKMNQPLDSFPVRLIPAQSDKHTPVAITVIPSGLNSANQIITFRDITRELEEEGEQTEFISTASHEMRTPVATIDGYLSLAINPQTATIDERARGYLTAAQAASKHLGKLFQNLLDVTKLDDGKIKLQMEPVEMVSLIKEIANDYLEQAKSAKITFNFGSSEPSASNQEHRMEQVVYGLVDVSFVREIMDNLIENALKYTPEGGSVYVNVRGDGDKVLINVTDTGIGISPDDLGHIFQKFYRVDNSDTRTIGGNGLGLYLVKQRAEALGGKVWAESAFGEGSTFYVSLPRLSSDEYEKRMIMVRNLEAKKQLEASKAPLPSVPSPVAPIAPFPPAAIKPVATNPFMSASASLQTPAPIASASANPQATASASPALSNAPVTSPTPPRTPVASPIPPSTPVASPIPPSTPTTPSTPLRPPVTPPAPPRAPVVPPAPPRAPVAPPVSPPASPPIAAPTTMNNNNNNNLNGEPK